MKTILRKLGAVEYGILGWFLLFCLLILMAITSEIKAKPVYLGQSKEKVQILTGVDIEVEK